MELISIKSGTEELCEISTKKGISMSRELEAKEKQGYATHPIEKACANCIAFADGSTATPYKQRVRSGQRCDLGEFEVIKTASCNQFSPK